MRDLDSYHRRTRERGVRLPVYLLAWALLRPAAAVWFRLGRRGAEQVPAHGAVILAANHRSFVDPFAIGLCLRRPVHFVSKRELFASPAVGWLLNSLGAFPIRRGESDADAMATAREVLERGEVLLIFPEGKRIRGGPVAPPRRGVGRLALETGAAVVPVAIVGSEHARRGWRVRPCRVRVGFGRPLTFPRVRSASPRLAQEVTGRIWPSVQLQWQSLGGPPPSSPVIGDGEGVEPGSEAEGAVGRAA